MARTPGSGFVTEAMLEDALSGIDTSGTVKTVNGVEPDVNGNVTLDVAAGALDPTDPSGLTLLLMIPSRPSVTLSVTADGWIATAAFTGQSPEGLALTYSLDWGDGTVTTPSSSPTSHTYASSAATYTVTITATDSEGGTATDSATVSVAPPGLSAYGAQVMQDGPVVYLPGSAEATPLADYMGLVSPTVLTGNVTSDTHPLGDGDRSIKFSNAAVSLGTPGPLATPGALTFECLYQQSIANAQGGLFNRNLVSGRRRGAWVNVTSDGFSLVVGRSDGEIATAPSGATTASDRWHVAVTWDGTTWTLYVNGSSVGTVTDSDSWGPTSTAPIELGWERTGAKTQYGWMGGIAFYNVALSPARIAAHVAAAGL